MVQTMQTPQTVAPPPAPAPPIRRRRVGPGGLAMAGLAAGAILVLGAGLWAVIAPGQLVKYPSDLDKTVAATGQFTTFVDPATGLPLASPLVQQLQISRHVYVTSSTGDTAVVAESDTETIGAQTLTLGQQYVIDRSSMRDVQSDQSWAYTQNTTIDRSPAYSINLPLDTGTGPYDLWKNQVGRAYSFTADGQPFTNDGVTVVRLRGHLDGASVIPAFIAQLEPAGLSSSTTLSALQPQLKAMGIDVVAITAALLPALTPAEQPVLAGVATASIPLSYTMSVDTSMLVEQRTGAIVSLEKIDETLFVRPDLAGLAPLVAVLAKHADIPAVQQALPALQKLQTAAPTKVFNDTYSQTPASVQEMSDYANGLGNNKTLVELYIPLGLGIVGALFVVVSAALWIARRRRTA